jgi:hypothetical protein
MNAEPTTHPTPTDLAAFGLGKLIGAAAAAVARHLESCDACRRAVENVPADSFVGLVRNARNPAAASPANPPAPPPSPEPVPELPAELAEHPRFRIVRELGRGGMGVVYQAEHRLMERPVAIKVINQSLIANAEVLQRFRREVKAAAQLAHPHIVAAYDAEQAGSLHLLVMEYVEGSSLAQVLERRGPLPVVHACHYARQAALGLQHAFERGMVHRDIKPQNLMLTPQGVIKILDFGLARLASERSRKGGLTQVNTVMGTPEFMAPEQATDARRADTRADVYSLGCTLYCLLAGRVPFQEDTALKTILAHLDQEPPPLRELRPEVPPAVVAVVERMMAKDPAQRYQTPAEVAQALLPFCKAGAKPAPAALTMVPRPAASARTGTVCPTDTSRQSVPRQEAAPAPPAREAEPRASAFEGLGAGAVESGRPGRRKAAAPAGWGRRWPVLAGVAAGVMALGALLLAGIILQVKTEDGTLVVEVNVPNPNVLIDGKEVTVTWDRGGKMAVIRHKPGTYMVEVEKDGVRAKGQLVTLEEGGQKTIQATLKQPPPSKPRVSDPKPAEGASRVHERAVGDRLAISNGRGKWRIEGDELVQRTSLPEACLQFGDATWQDYDFTAEAMRVEGNGDLSVIFRGEDVGNFYFLGFSGGGDRHHILGSTDGGKGRILARVDGAVQSNRWYRLLVKVRDQHIQGFLDRANIFDFTDKNDRHPRGRVGLRTWAGVVRFRNIKVTSPDGKVLWEGLPDLPDTARVKDDPKPSDKGFVPPFNGKDLEGGR